MYAQLRSFAKVVVAVLAVGAGGTAYQLSRERGTRLAFLAVGQGDSTVFQHDGRTLLIDCGPARDGYDAGERLVAPKLYDLGVRTLDVVVLTHPDSDHIGGLRALSRRFKIGRIIANIAFRGHRGLQHSFSSAHIDGRSVVWVSGRAWIHWNTWSIRIDAPAPVVDGDDNAGSLFVRIADAHCSALLTGDAPLETEEAMILRKGPWAAQVLKAGHHGSATSTGDRLLAIAGPRDVAISCGRNNVYGHPTPAALDRIRYAGARALRTDREGDLIFEPSPSGFRRVPAGR